MRANSKISALTTNRIVTGLFFLLAVGFASHVAWNVYAEYDRLTSTAEHKAALGAVALEEQASRAFGEVGWLLVNFADRCFGDAPLSPAEERDLHDRLAAAKASLPQVSSIVLTNAQGIVIAEATRYPAVHRNISRSDHFRAQMEGRMQGGIAIGAPVVSKLTGRELIPVSRRINDTSGNFCGVVAAALDPDYLAAFYAKFLPDADAAISLRRDDGFVLVRTPNPGPPLLRKVDAEAIGETARSGILRLVSPIDNIERIAAYRKAANFPVTVVYAIPTHAILRNWGKSSLRIAIPGSFLFIVLMGFGLYFNSSRKNIQTLAAAAQKAHADYQRELERQVADQTAELRREVHVRSRAEAALRASRERLKAITDSLFEGVMVIDRNGRIRFANASARRFLAEGHHAKGPEGQPLDHFMAVRAGGEDIGFADSPWRRVLAEKVTLTSDDAVFVKASGRAVAVAYACSPLADGQGRTAAIISFRDIEALKRAQTESMQSSRLASVGQLAAGIAHEINTPVQYIGDNLRFIATTVDSLFAALSSARQLSERANAEAAARFEAELAALQVDFLGEETPAAIRESQEGVAQIARIVLSMKEFSHPGNSAKAMTDLNRCLESTLTVSRNAWKQVAEIDRRFDPELPSVLCHAGEMNQVFLNLIVNAAQAIEASGKSLPGRIAVTTSRDGEQVTIRIEDSGTGIPEGLRDRIFDPFFTTKDVGKGTGQGLAICRNVVVTKHGGSIEVDGREGQGAIFTLRLPIEGHAAAGPDEESA